LQHSYRCLQSVAFCLYQNVFHDHRQGSWRNWSRTQGSVPATFAQLNFLQHLTHLAGLALRPQPIPYDEACKTLKAALNAAANFWNVGNFYGLPDGSLPLLKHYFTSIQKTLIASSSA
jgi:hypothetical protein